MEKKLECEQICRSCGKPCIWFRGMPISNCCQAPIKNNCKEIAMTQKIEEAIVEFEEFMKPKVFCGRDHCSGLFNLPCDDINHNDGRELVQKSKVLHFLESKLSQFYQAGREDEREEMRKEIDEVDVSKILH
jgi:hypothetical protein